MIEKNLVFIFGEQRTGTTMLLNILSKHKDVQVVPNDFALSKLFEGFPSDGVERKKLGSWRIAPLVENPSWLHKGMSKEAILRIILGIHFYESEAEVLLYKSPKEEMYLDTYLTAFPKAKIILTMRNPIAIMSSRKYWQKTKRANLFGKDGVDIDHRRVSFEVAQDYFERSKLDLVRILNSLKIIDKNIQDSRMSLFVYEDFVSDPKGGLVKISTFLGLSPEYSTMKLKTPRPYTSYVENRKIRGVYKNSLYAWKSKLMEIEIDSILNQMVIFYTEYDFLSRRIESIFLSYINDIEDQLELEKTEKKLVKKKVKDGAALASISK